MEASGGLARISVHAWGYGVTLLAQAAAGLLQTVILLATLGPARWASVSVAQTTGLLGATLVSAGLTSFGASVVALQPEPERAARTLASLRARGILCAWVAGPVAVALLLLAPASPGATAIIGAASLLPGTAASWYFIGRRSPLRWLRADIVPVGLGALAGALLTIAVPRLEVFAACYLTGAVAAVVLSARAVRSDLGPGAAFPEQVRTPDFLREHRPLLAAALAGGVNGQGPAILMAAVGASASPTYLLLDRLVKYVIATAAPAVQFAQGWVPAGGPERAPGRARLALSVAAAAAAATAFAFAFGADDVAGWLSHDKVVVGQPELALFSALAGLLVLAQVTALSVLVPLRLEQMLSSSTVAGALVLLAAGPIAARVFALPGVAVVTLAAEGGILAFQVGAALRRITGAPSSSG